MSESPKHRSPSTGGVRANRRPGDPASWPPKQHAAPRPHLASQDRRGPAPRPPFGQDTEGLCQTMPEIGMMPFKSDRARGRQVVRLVSTVPGAELSIELQPGPNRVGRQRNNNHIVLVSPQVSRFHAEIDVRDGDIVLRDLGSANGTFVNGKRIATEPLNAGDTIAFSDQFVLRLLIDLAVEEADSLTYDSVAELVPQDGPVCAVDSVPPSLEQRLGSSPGLDPARLEPVTSAPPLRIASVQSVEIPLAPGESDATNRLPGRAAPATAGRDGVRSPWASEPQTDPEASALPPDPLTDALPSPDEIAFDDVTHLSGASPAAGLELAEIDRERRRLAVLYQVSKRCMAASSLEQLDALLIAVLERVVAFERGFITYQLPSGDWKLVMSPRGDRWERELLRDLVQLALSSLTLLRVSDSWEDGRLGREATQSDCRLLLPLRTPAGPVGAIFLLARDEPFDDHAADFLDLLGDIAALAIVNCARLESSAG